jgi:hypothetical protein
LSRTPVQGVPGCAALNHSADRRSCKSSGVILDPELFAVLSALGLAALISLPGLRRALLRRRHVKRFCASCGRRLVHDRKTCECDF